MLGRLIENATRRPVGTIVIFVCVSIAGVIAMLKLPMELYPSLDYPRMNISTYWPGASPFSVECEVTSIIEGELAMIEGVASVRSYSSEGRSRVELYLHRNADLEYTRFAVSEKLQTLKDIFPSSVYPSRIEKYVPKELSASIFISYSLTGPRSETRLREIALDEIEPALKCIPGVVRVDVVGGRDRQIHVVFDSEELQKYDLDATDIKTALESTKMISTAGSVFEGGKNVHIVLTNRPKSLREVENLPLFAGSGRIIVLNDVAEVVEGMSPLHSIQRINGQPKILIKIDRDPESNTVTVAKKVHEVIDEIQKNLPAGVKLIKESDQSEIINSNIHRLLFRITFSFLVILLVLTAFLHNLRYAVIIQASIVVSIAISMLLMFISGYSLNLITLAGLALGFGFLVDNSIVVLESIIVSQEKGYSTVEVGLPGVSSVIRPLVAATLTTVVALLPFVYLLEDLKLFYFPFAIVVSLALIVSLIVSLFLVPVLTRSMLVTRRNLDSPVSCTETYLDTMRSNRMHKVYSVILRKCLTHPGITVLIALFLFGLPFWLLPGRIEYPEKTNSPLKKVSEAYNSIMGSRAILQIRPIMNHALGGSSYLFFRYVDRYEVWNWNDQTYIRADIILPPGTPVKTTDRIVMRLEKSVENIEGISRVRSQAFSNNGSVTIVFLPEYEFTLTPLVSRRKLIAVANGIGNSRITITGFGPGFSRGYGAASIQNRLLLTGYDYGCVTELTDDVVKRLEGYRRVTNIRVEASRRYSGEDIYDLYMSLDQPNLSIHNVNARELLGMISPYFVDDSRNKRLHIEDEEIAFSIYSKESGLFQFHELKNLKMKDRYSREFPLNNVSSFEKINIPPIIERLNQQYCQTISFDYMAPYRQTRKFVDDFITQTTFPQGYALGRLDGFLFADDSGESITVVLLIALVLMYMVLAGLYESFSYPFLIFFIIPLSLIGVFSIYFVTGSVFDQSAYIGVIMLFGIVLNNGIILLDRINVLIKEKQDSHLDDLIVEGCNNRLRPVLLTTITTVAGLLPLVMLASSDKSSDIWYSLSLSTIGGLLSGTALGLFVLPALFCLVHKARRYRTK